MANMHISHIVYSAVCLIFGWVEIFRELVSV